MNAYGNSASKIDSKELIGLYSDYYKNKPFIEVSSTAPNTSDVRGSNRCKIRPMVDERTKTITITAVIDNLMKGQSGNAVQNANILMDFDETSGLDFPAFYP